MTEGSKRMHTAFSKWCLRSRYPLQQQPGLQPAILDEATQTQTRSKVVRLLCLARCQEIFFGIVYGWLLLENFSLEHIVIIVSFFGFALIDTANLVCFVS